MTPTPGEPRSERTERGEALVELLSPGFGEDLRAAIGSLAPDMVDLTIEVAFGDVYSRPGLDLRARQIATIAALVTLGAVDQLRIHLRIALKVGITRQEIAEELVQLAVYAGWPRSLTALRVAAEELGTDGCQ